MLIVLSLKSGELSAPSRFHLSGLVHCPSKLKTPWEKQSLQMGSYSFLSHLCLHLTYQLV